MSLSTLLLQSAQGKIQGVDEQLDAIFHSTTSKHDQTHSDHASESKKRKSHSRDVSLPSKKTKTGKDNNTNERGRRRTGDTPSPHTKTEKKSKLRTRLSGEVALITALKDETHKAGSSARHVHTVQGDLEDSSEPPPVHESLQRTDSKPTGQTGYEFRTEKKVKYAPPDETAQQRDSRTIFVGNVPVETAKSKTLLKQFKKHILSFIPSAQIESVRFRSIAFQKPTTKLSNDEHDTGKEPPKKQKQSRQHDVDRVSSWRESNDAEADVMSTEKKHLTPQEKKRVAFIKHDFHEGMDVVTAYVVFAHPQPPHTRAPNVPAPAPVLDPHHAARSAVEKCNGSVFNHKTLRVDHVQDSIKSQSSGSSISGDLKLTLFIGNLDFESKEEDLRAFFEGLISAERGPRPQDPDIATADEPHSCLWVTRVRLIRDKDTQLGKGFAYVQFADRLCVDEILAMEQDKIRFAKRKLRVQRCKSLVRKPNGDPTSALPRTDNMVSISHVPKGDPSLGKRLQNMSKEERKKHKASDADRVARRLAKKEVKAAKRNADVKAKIGDSQRPRSRTNLKRTTVVPKMKRRRIKGETNLHNKNFK